MTVTAASADRAAQRARMRTVVTTPMFGRHSPEPWRILETAEIEAVIAPPPPQTSPADLVELAAEADALVVGLDRVERRLFEIATGLKVVANHGVGYDNIDVAAAHAHGVEVLFASGSSSRAVAEHAFALILAGARHLVSTDADVRAGRWPKMFGPELGGQTVGVLGFGRIGWLVAGFAGAFGMTVLAHDPYVTEDVFDAAGVRGTSLDRCLSAADVVTLHLPALPGGEPLLDRARLASMRPGARLVNTARGDLVDEGALADLLTEGHLGGAALDAFATEPLPEDSPLRAAPNVVPTPHLGACSHQANHTMGVVVAEDVVRVLSGQRPLHAVTGGRP